jgi:hypothetical protein
MNVAYEIKLESGTVQEERCICIACEVRLELILLMLPGCRGWIPDHLYHSPPIYNACTPPTSRSSCHDSRLCIWTPSVLRNNVVSVDDFCAEDRIVFQSETSD